MYVLHVAGKHDVRVREASELPNGRATAGCDGTRRRSGVLHFGADTTPEELARVRSSTRAIMWPKLRAFAMALWPTAPKAGRDNEVRARGRHESPIVGRDRGLRAK